jgi:hypothetical protein
MLSTAEKLGSLVATEGIADAIARLFVDAVGAWSSSAMNELPNKVWLSSYLTKEAIVVYQAWNVDDTVKAVYSYFCYHERADTLQQLTDLCNVCGVQVADARYNHR